MKVHFIHNNKGEIFSFAINHQSEGRTIIFQPQKKQRVAEIDIPELKADNIKDAPKILKKYLDEHFVTKGKDGNSVLAKKPSKEAKGKKKKK